MRQETKDVNEVTLILQNYETFNHLAILGGVRIKRLCLVMVMVLAGETEGPEKHVYVESFILYVLVRVWGSCASPGRV